MRFRWNLAHYSSFLNIKRQQINSSPNEKIDIANTHQRLSVVDPEILFEYGPIRRVCVGGDLIQVKVDFIKVIIESFKVWGKI